MMWGGQRQAGLQRVIYRPINKGIDLSGHNIFVYQIITLYILNIYFWLSVILQ